MNTQDWRHRRQVLHVSPQRWAWCGTKDFRCMADLVEASALLSPRDLEGRRAEVGENGATLRVLEPYECNYSPR